MEGETALNRRVCVAMPCRQNSEVEDGTANYYASEFGSVVPRGLLRGMLSESMSTEGLCASLALKGSRLCTCSVKEGPLLLAHASGAVHDLLTLTVLSPADRLSQFKVNKHHEHTHRASTVLMVLP